MVQREITLRLRGRVVLHFILHNFGISSIFCNACIKKKTCVRQDMVPIKIRVIDGSLLKISFLNSFLV